MIIDSHAHYARYSFRKEGPYLTMENGILATASGDLSTILADMAASGIRCSVEPGVELSSNEDVLALARACPGRIFPAVGIHPKRVAGEQWKNRRQLDAHAQTEGVVAIGETGFDYSLPRQEQYRAAQLRWFLYQLGLARRTELPVILHVRDAHRDALRILRLHPARKLGGVAHCFNGTREEAMAYVKLGYHIGIGGSLLQQKRAAPLEEAVKAIPLERILIETDAPFIKPDRPDHLESKIYRKSQNTSLILPAVIAKIAELKGISPEIVAQATAQNAIRLFRLPIDETP